jgi:hypothetical protein
MSAGKTTFEQRLGQLVKMLDAPSDGECLNAARSITRLLKSNGRDLHWLADLVDPLEFNGAAPAVTYSEAEAMEIYQKGIEKGRAEAGRNAAGDEHRNPDGTASLHGMAMFLLGKIGDIDERHHQFIRKCASRTANDWELTWPMQKYLKSLYFEYGGRP